MITNIKYKSYIVFAIINFATIPCVYFFYPETCGLPLEAVDLLFADRDGKRPSLLQVVRDSRRKEYLAEIEVTLQERARARADGKGALNGEKSEPAQFEHVGSGEKVA